MLYESGEVRKHLALQWLFLEKARQKGLRYITSERPFALLADLSAALELLSQ